MTRSTHQVAAFATALGAIILVHPLIDNSTSETELDPWMILFANLLGLPPGNMPPVPLQAGFLYIFAAIIGGILPDLDRRNSVWSRVLTSTLLGGHRHLSHSILGLVLAGILALAVLAPLGPLLSVPVGLLWLGFIAGYASHLMLDGLTHDGVPLLFPARIYFGLPPFAEMRMRTGGWMEQFIVMPALLTLIAWTGFRYGNLLTSIWG